MSKQLTPTNTSAIDPGAIENFYSLINKEPSRAAVQENRFADNAKYLSIGYLEMKLDELFFGLWKSETVDSKVVANEFVVTVQVSVFHPVAGQWITRTGIGAVPIQQKRGSLPTDLNAKIVNAMQKNAPAAKAFAFKNAVKGYGKIFGRDLNREDVEYTPGTTQVMIAEKQLELVKDSIAAAGTTEKLSAIFKKHKSLPGIPELITIRREEIKAA